MNVFNPAEIGRLYVEAGSKKAGGRLEHMAILGLLAGFLIGMGAGVTNTAAHALTDAGLARTLSGLLFPFGLGIVMLMGAELFTGNCMIPLAVAASRATVPGMLRNWLVVYASNFAGAAAVAAACVYAGQLEYSDGMLAAYTIKVAAAKCSLGFGPAVVLGILCNLLVCLGVLCSISAKDTTGKILGAYIPVAFFVICGFEHSVANMFYIPAGLFAAKVSAYAEHAAVAGLDLSALTWSNFIFKNLIPVTLGNILAGAMLASLLWRCHVRRLAPRSSGADGVAAGKLPGHHR